MRLTDLPAFIPDAKAYEKWLKGRAAAHVKRDRRRGIEQVNELAYRDAIHAAVLASEGRDCYTGEELRWDLCGTYDNAASKAGRHGYKAQFNLMPSVDHHDAAATVASFKICAWRTNDSKHDLTEKDFIDLCRKIVAHADRTT